MAVACACSSATAWSIWCSGPGDRSTRLSKAAMLIRLPRTQQPLRHVQENNEPRRRQGRASQEHPARSRCKPWLG